MKLTPSRGEPADDFEELFEFRPAENRRRLIEHNDAGIARQGAGNFDHLPLRDAQALEVRASGSTWKPSRSIKL